jgi:hypothetical protein
MPPQHEVYLGKYTSSIVMKKSGMLELFDSAIWHLMIEYMPKYLEHDQPPGDSDGYERKKASLADIAGIKKPGLSGYCSNSYVHDHWRETEAGHDQRDNYRCCWRRWWRRRLM